MTKRTLVHFFVHVHNMQLLSVNFTDVMVCSIKMCNNSSDDIWCNNGDLFLTIADGQGIFLKRAEFTKRPPVCIKLDPHQGSFE